ncbi:7,8-didemethyl-8-hydroxy-5-deazariboflavin synthase subunit CofG [Coleofasciculus sp. FACHB-SPT36]|uniref:7,8-didemethyl-8-hydroxy-5-deazariboflavin synthase subunit CofG n=1 Tax=Cyanophyceae TaxID=3028117 RepID=UPI00168BA584|nr:7,8-didemethyl-8-hydroxy-5-deazariboflavin synthase subunit CofG [Coleofasciculus sp. FACHB-SPT36]MBD2538688.1 7,8-didemethyl-8-hydroxy-5-deazariboflavin synthase subunit CofG [Coleofasciculus sp. FACHB-SPT36]
MSSSRIVTYSPAYTVVPTYECFNRCSYCNFRTDPGKSPWLTLSEAERVLRSLASQNVCEILILSGEVHPHSSRRQAWFQHIYDLCELALSMGFLPHTNAGPLSFEEMQKLKEVNVSMGLMLEQLTPQLLQTVHKHAPSKVPELRLQQLEWAGELRIPFTTGLLLGIGETEQDWWETLEAIALLHQRYNHIQEVILQPHSPGTQQTFDAPPFDPHQLPAVIAKARHILPPDITIQIPPNLVPDSSWLIACVEAGARDLGGIGPKDEVNPDYPHPQYHQLKEILEPAGWELVPRLPVYPQYDNWLSDRLQSAVNQWQGATLLEESMK